MKMENELRAPRDGVVTQVKVRSGECGGEGPNPGRYQRPIQLRISLCLWKVEDYLRRSLMRHAERPFATLLASYSEPLREQIMLVFIW